MSDARPARFFTIGHSTRSLEELVGMLAANGVTQLVDVRRLPGSRRFPHVNEDALRETLPARGIRYHRIPELTGRRGRSPGVDPQVNGFWRNQSFHNYADHALGDDFAAGIDRLREIADEGPTAIMCSEAVWWRCHRRIIADHLLAQGDDVSHILSEHRTDAATLTPGADVAADGTVTYPAETA